MKNKYKLILMLLTIFIGLYPVQALSLENQTISNTSGNSSNHKNTLSYSDDIVSISVTPPTLLFTYYGRPDYYGSIPVGIRNIGNVNIDIYVQARNDFTDGNKKILLNESQYLMYAQVALSSKGTNYLLKTNLTPDGLFNFSHTILVPHGTAPGTYTTNLTYTAIKSQSIQ